MAAVQGYGCISSVYVSCHVVYSLLQFAVCQLLCWAFLFIICYSILFLYNCYTNYMSIFNLYSRRIKVMTILLFLRTFACKRFFFCSLYFHEIFCRSYTFSFFLYRFNRVDRRNVTKSCRRQCVRPSKKKSTGNRRLDIGAQFLIDSCRSKQEVWLPIFSQIVTVHTLLTFISGNFTFQAALYQ